MPAQLTRRHRGYVRETFDWPLPLATEKPDLFRRFFNRGIIGDSTAIPRIRRLAGRPGLPS